MNIHTAHTDICQYCFMERGSKLTFRSRAYDRNDLFAAGQNAKLYLETGKNYSVNTIYPYDCFTFVELIEYPGVLFYLEDFSKEH